MTFLAETSGYCCLWAFMTDNAHKRPKVWAKQLGVSLRTVQSSRMLIRERVTRCRNLEKNRCAKDWVGTGEDR